MDTVEKARTNLRRERKKVAERRAEVVDNRNRSKDRGEKRRLGNLVDKHDMHLEVIDYVLNILEST